MIFEVSIKPEQTYTCQNCQKSLGTFQNYVIRKEYFPVCSYSCLWNVMYTFFKKLDYNLNKELFWFMNPKHKLFYEYFSPLNNKKELILDNARIITKILLSSIKQEVIIIKTLSDNV